MCQQHLQGMQTNVRHNSESQGIHSSGERGKCWLSHKKGKGRIRDGWEAQIGAEG